jgi:hypothetical protein
VTGFEEVEQMLTALLAAPDPVLFEQVAGLYGFNGEDFEDGAFESVRCDLGVDTDGCSLARGLAGKAEALGSEWRDLALHCRDRVVGLMAKQRQQFPDLVALDGWTQEPRLLRQMDERAWARWFELLPVCVRTLLLALLVRCRQRDPRTIRRALIGAGFARNKRGWVRTFPRQGARV